MSKFFDWLARMAGKTETKADDKAVSAARRTWNDIKFIMKKGTAVGVVFAAGLLAGAIIF